MDSMLADKAQERRLVESLAGAGGTALVQDLLQLVKLREVDAIQRLRKCKKEDLDAIQAELAVYEKIRGWFRPSPVGAEHRNYGS